MSKIVALQRLIEVKETEQVSLLLCFLLFFLWHANHVNYGRGNIISYRPNMISNDRLELARRTSEREKEREGECAGERNACTWQRFSGRDKFEHLC